MTNLRSARKPVTSAALATKKLLGTLAVVALMSVILAKFFSDLAFADESLARQTPSKVTQIK
jgi:hypothetical protein